MEEDSPVTLGIGVICEGGKYVILASDTRASYGNPAAEGISPNDRAGKQWDFHPFKLVASVAGQLGTAHNVVSQLTIEIEKLLALQESGTTLCREHIENAINEARIHETGRQYNSASRLYFHVTLQQLLRGKLKHGTIDRYAWEEMKKMVFSLPLPVEIILGGFLGDEPILMKASGKRQTETDSDPPVFTIGSTGSKRAMEHLNKRGQHIYSGLAQSLLHIHEAAEIARNNDKSIGLCPGYIIMGADFKGFGQMAHNAPCLTGWAAAYKDRPTTDSLNNDMSRAEAKHCINVLSPSPRFKYKRPPKHAARLVSRKSKGRQ
jgi:hypothetical protein